LFGAIFVKTNCEVLVEIFMRINVLISRS